MLLNRLMFSYIMIFPYNMSITYMPITCEMKKIFLRYCIRKHKT